MTTRRVTRSQATTGDASATAPASASSSASSAPAPAPVKRGRGRPPSTSSSSSISTCNSTSTSTKTRTTTTTSSHKKGTNQVTKQSVPEKIDGDDIAIEKTESKTSLNPAATTQIKLVASPKKRTHTSHETDTKPSTTEPVAGLQNLPTAEPNKRRGRSSTSTTSTSSTPLSINSSLLYDAIVLDIEGTTTPITFVHKILFPYAEDHLEEYLEQTWNTNQTKKDVQALIDAARTDVANQVPGVIPIDPLPSTRKKQKTESKEDMDVIHKRIRQQVIDNVRWQISCDRKATALKQLQGHMWAVGYQKGELMGEFYDDVIPQIKIWHEKGVKLYIYSSGSIEAQKLIFGHTPEGSLLPYLSGYFDTTTGPKQETSSYTKIATSIGTQPKRILFLTDIHGEAVAANQAGIPVKLLLRPGNAALPASHTFHTTPDFHFSIDAI